MTLLRRGVLLAIAAATFGACSTTATITRRSDAPLEAKIVRGTPVSVMVVEGDGERAVARDEIVDIDHPGNVSAVVGGLLSAYGLFNIAVGAPSCDEKGAQFCAGVFLPATVGIALLTWGLVVWSGSSSGAAQTWSAGPGRRARAE